MSETVPENSTPWARIIASRMIIRCTGMKMRVYFIIACHLTLPEDEKPERFKRESRNMEYLVGCFDVLNMQVTGMNDEIGGDISGAFIKPLRFILARHPGIRVEVFYDSLVAGCEPAFTKEMVVMVSELFRAWCVDYILVKGALVLGEIDSVSGSFEKMLLDKLQKIRMHRLSGQAVVEAYKLSAHAYPGMCCLVNPQAEEFIRAQAPGFLGEMNPVILNWVESKKIESYQKLFQEMLESQELYVRELRPHIFATLQFINQFRNLSMA